MQRWKSIRHLVYFMSFRGRMFNTRPGHRYGRVYRVSRVPDSVPQVNLYSNIICYDRFQSCYLLCNTYIQAWVQFQTSVYTLNINTPGFHNNLCKQHKIFRKEPIFSPDKTKEHNTSHKNEMMCFKKYPKLMNTKMDTVTLAFGYS